MKFLDIVSKFPNVSLLFPKRSRRIFFKLGTTIDVRLSTELISDVTSFVKMIMTSYSEIFHFVSVEENLNFLVDANGISAY